MNVETLVGTAKGAFLLRSGAEREHWSVEGPLFKGWKVTAAARTAEGDTFVATASDVYGAALHVSRDLVSWRQIERGPEFDKGGERKLNQIWTLVLGPGRYYAGVDEAGLFASEDKGESWFPVEGLNEHPTRSAWYPGAGGLCAHAVLVDPTNPDRVWCGISAVGVFRTDDGGLTWHSKNEGVPFVIEDKVHKDIGRCVHGLVMDPEDPDTIWRREHIGMFRTKNGGETWERIQNGLDSSFGFPIARDAASHSLFAIPLESDEYRMPSEGSLRVYKSTDAGETWVAKTAGLPQKDAYAGVLRGALTVDGLDPAGVTFGTTSGTVYTSRDAGESWKSLPANLPRVLCVESFATA